MAAKRTWGGRSSRRENVAAARTRSRRRAVVKGTHSDIQVSPSPSLLRAASTVLRVLRRRRAMMRGFGFLRGGSRAGKTSSRTWAPAQGPRPRLSNRPSWACRRGHEPEPSREIFHPEAPQRHPRAAPYPTLSYHGALAAYASANIAMVFPLPLCHSRTAPSLCPKRITRIPVRSQSS